MLTVIPFAGFYYSLHDSELDETLKRVFTDRETGCDLHEGLHWAAFSAVNWSHVHSEYAKAYAQSFAEHFKIALKFESLQSPREYNFATDRIFCEIEPGEVSRIFAQVNKATLSDVCREMFTSRSGFISHYSPDWKSWGDVETWDHNQLLALIASLVRDTEGEDWDQFREYGLMEDVFCNGHADNWIFGSNPKPLNRLARIHDYLQERAAR